MSQPNNTLKRPLSANSVTQSDVDAAQKSLDTQSDNGYIDREMIQEKQKQEAGKIKEHRHTLLRRKLPAYVFAINPEIKTFNDPKKTEKAGKPPSIIQQEVIRAQASAELNVYLSYLTTNEKKVEFLQEWEQAATKIQNEKDSSVELMNKLKKEIWNEFGQPRHPKGNKKKAEQPMYYVHDLDPLYGQPRKNGSATPASGPRSRWGSVAGIKPSFSVPNYGDDSSSITAKSSTGGTSPESASPKSSPKSKRTGEKKK